MPIAIVTYVELEKAVRVPLGTRLEPVSLTCLSVAGQHFLAAYAAAEQESHREH